MNMSKKGKPIDPPKGISTILPEDQKYYRYILKKAEAIFDYYGFERIDAGILESSDVFTRTMTADSDEEKELFSFKTKNSEYLALKYDNQVSVAQAYINNGMNSRPHPVKLFYVSSSFRNIEGRRQTLEMGVETIGDDSEIIDAELIFMAHKLIESMSIGEYSAYVNSMGESSCRPAYIRALKDYFKNKSKKLCSACRDNLKTNPLKILNCQVETCKEVNKEVPQTVDYLCDECHVHFKHTLEYLDEVGVPYILNPILIRGREYHTRTAFDFISDANPELAPVIQGGRHDRLIDTLGGSRTPAAGWTMNLDQIVTALKEKQASVPDGKIKPKIFLIQLGEMAKKKSLILFENFRKAGIEAKSSLGRDSIKSQLRIAHRLGVKFALIFGQKEALDNTMIVREINTGVQETIPVEKIIEEIKKKLKT
ncbi:MAG: Histidine-tRNA ligase [Candidatus Yanofskybacteria bacterium GW2011_GWA1_44_21]|uniref:Histidine--tRNA ligase n=2 Tax=Candidatus Yanofskyibacteriota TaxID=1752733 RepID=A0A0G1N9N3_9BACT|nr:MAG: Histidine-tRNA ligase [Candidatus Yanofskybacteria bacterium GW2011_GWA2_44_10]KKT50667.1 MAG: Histidine-tRNA ligase [Candidatus Yanofskybacteria bacterium GW2011_GWA1_44_21]KKT89807.1 MAG: Histidine-tRNA ligase [Candidatus Yanofskybacteria bacterium GW2011_GWB1_45_11]OGN14792.1 MAG: histidine--tRNA ligase [Candidatus Yanofskybacteria bacterium RIFCSPHIGHO2_02_FULL_44_36b]